MTYIEERYIINSRMMTVIDEIKKTILQLFKSDVTTYRISKETGISISSIDRYRDNTSSLENMTLTIAGKLCDYAEKAKGEGLL